MGKSISTFIAALLFAANLHAQSGELPNLRYTAEFELPMIVRLDGSGPADEFDLKIPSTMKLDFTLLDAQSITYHSLAWTASVKTHPLRDGDAQVTIDLDISMLVEDVAPLDLNPLIFPHTWDARPWRSENTPIAVEGIYRSLSFEQDFAGDMDTAGFHTQSLEGRLRYDDWPNGVHGEQLTFHPNFGSQDYNGSPSDGGSIELEPEFAIVAIATPFFSPFSASNVTFTPVTNTVEPKQAGDIDGDGSVDFTDFLVLSSNFNMPGNAANGDLDGDGLIAFSDFLILSTNFGHSIATASIPEPAGLDLIMTGVVWFAAWVAFGVRQAKRTPICRGRRSEVNRSSSPKKRPARVGGTY